MVQVFNSHSRQAFLQLCVACDYTLQAKHTCSILAALSGTQTNEIRHQVPNVKIQDTKTECTHGNHALNCSHVTEDKKLNTTRMCMSFNYVHSAVPGPLQRVALLKWPALFAMAGHYQVRNAHSFLVSPPKLSCVQQSPALLQCNVF